jgi:hypothetical protein
MVQRKLFGEGIPVEGIKRMDIVVANILPGEGFWLFLVVEYSFSVLS